MVSGWGSPLTQSNNDNKENEDEDLVPVKNIFGHGLSREREPWQLPEFTNLDEYEKECYYNQRSYYL